MNRLIVILCIILMATNGKVLAQQRVAFTNTAFTSIMADNGNGDGGFDGGIYKSSRMKRYKKQMRKGMAFMIAGGAQLVAGGIVYGATNNGDGTRSLGAQIAVDVLVADGAIMFFSGLYDFCYGKAHLRHYHAAKVSLAGTRNGIGVAYNFR